MSHTLHPARESEFLSRLHDGELAADEGTAFEAHSAHCPECRNAVASFERALAAYRGAETIPAATDLSARILRKIRAQSPARRPFGVMFGIDIRWAGVFVAALLVLLVAAPLRLRQKESLPLPSPAPIPARILVAPAESKDAPLQEARPAPAQSAPRSGPSGATPTKDELRAPALGRVNPAPAAPPATSAASELALKDIAAEIVVSAEAPLVDTDRVKTAGTRDGIANQGRAEIAEKPGQGVHLSVRAADGEGPSPAIVASPPDEQLAAVRGREFLIVVDAEGRVSEARSADSSSSRSSRQKAASAEGTKHPDPLEILRELRFQPGERSRRLLVRIE